MVANVKRHAGLEFTRKTTTNVHRNTLILFIQTATRHVGGFRGFSVEQKGETGFYLHRPFANAITHTLVLVFISYN